MLSKIQSVLQESFVFTEDVARILALGFEGKKNVLVFGPGGHAKSEMVSAVIDGLGLSNETFVQFFGEGMDEAKLFGGLNFAKLEAEKVLEYYPERSFLNYRIAVFEELFDAPANVLLALKDTLTAKELRNGAQRFTMRTEIIIVLTNKEPNEISELGPAAHALIERFPLQFNLKWKDYSSKSYLSMFEKRAPKLGGPVVNGFKAILAEILAKATAEGNFVSPRTAMHAYQVCQTAACLRNAPEVGQEDLIDLRFVPGLEGLAETIEGDLKLAMEKAQAEKSLTVAEKQLQSLHVELEERDTPIPALVVAKKLLGLQDEVAKISVPDSHTKRRQELRDGIGKAIAEAQAKALERTNIPQTQEA